jgi:hypothetical protein
VTYFKAICNATRFSSYRDERWLKSHCPTCPALGGCEIGFGVVAMLAYVKADAERKAAKVEGLAVYPPGGVVVNAKAIDERLDITLAVVADDEPVAPVVGEGE